MSIPDQYETERYLREYMTRNGSENLFYACLDLATDLLHWLDDQSSPITDVSVGEDFLEQVFAAYVGDHVEADEKRIMLAEAKGS